ncbi:ATP-grasp domain-containing protein [Streptomyces sp. NPDC048275]|uniref:ATP-grasp domain-containing protein n=1 Tax=Streptomyces sp. NPDC048275 TaxID=3155629 RepID=UPI0033C4EDB0
MRTSFLICGDPLRPTHPDPAFADEVSALRAAGADLALLDHDALVAGDAGDAVRRVPRDSGAYWYRGWMIPVRRYEELERALEQRGCSLLTSAARYRRAHELPGWYEVFEVLTPTTVWTAAAAGKPPYGTELSELTAGLRPGAGVVKDYVKSRKHEWDEACFVPDLSDLAHLSAVVERLFALQEDSLVGGLVVREYEAFVRGGEARAWWVDSEVVLVTAHPDSPGDCPVPRLDAVRAAVAALDCRFVTTDLALREDGEWRVVEVGDGQVSGVPRGADIGRLVGALAVVDVSGGSEGDRACPPPAP